MHPSVPIVSPKPQPKVIRDSNLDFWIDADPDVCRIVPKVYRIHSFVHFAKYFECG